MMLFRGYLRDIWMYKNEGPSNKWPEDTIEAFGSSGNRNRSIQIAIECNRVICVCDRKAETPWKMITIHSIFTVVGLELPFDQELIYLLGEVCILAFCGWLPKEVSKERHSPFPCNEIHPNS